MLSSFCFAQNTASNRPELAKKILDSYVEMAEARGIEVRERLYTIDNLLFFPNGANDHIHTNGVCTIRIGIGNYESDEEILRVTFHEIGHHMGIRDCKLCSYNIMSEFQDGTATYLFNKNAVRSLYIDIYFEAIRNPKKYNDGHTHY